MEASVERFFQVCFWERRKLQLVAACASKPVVVSLLLVVLGFVREEFAGPRVCRVLKMVPRMAMIPFQLPRTAGSWTFVIRAAHSLATARLKIQGGGPYRSSLLVTGLYASFKYF